MLIYMVSEAASLFMTVPLNFSHSVYQRVGKNKYLNWLVVSWLMKLFHLSCFKTLEFLKKLS